MVVLVKRWLLNVLLLGLTCWLGAAACGREMDPDGTHLRWPELRAQEFKGTRPAQDNAIAVPPPPFSDGVFPCTECHDGKDVKLERRKLTEEHSKILLRHGTRERWCFDCHAPTDRDKLRLASGSLVEFKESYRLCGQCHGPKLRDWRAGVHGRRSGSWSGAKRYRLCVHCHDPHAPKFKPIVPKPAPKRPAQIKRGPSKTPAGSAGGEKKVRSAS
jgi:hypothetical protein